MQIRLHIQVHWRGKSEQILKFETYLYLPFPTEVTSGTWLAPIDHCSPAGSRLKEHSILAGTSTETAKGAASYRQVRLDLGSTKVEGGRLSSVVAGSTWLPSRSEAYAHLLRCANGVPEISSRVFQQLLLTLRSKRRLVSFRTFLKPRHPRPPTNPLSHSPHWRPGQGGQPRR
jgi:hypothetical protein